jgi:dihydroneopterin aldolase/2-amino-4-hydroxy-6-hydroxymethyldihydropteridine diphosphokinase
MFKVLVKDFNLFGYHGVREHEKRDGQNFCFNIEIFINKYSFIDDDSIDSTINYSDVIRQIKNLNTKKRFDLLETFSEVLAYQIMDMSPLVEKVIVKIEKTSPPIKEDRRAVSKISKHPYIDIAVVSSIYKTEPMYVKEQDTFYNIVLRTGVKKEFSSFELLGFLKSIEYEMGRERNDKRYGPRIIDIDILYYGDICIDSNFLTIPHPKLSERNFVLIPLCEISPDLEIGGKIIRKFIKDCDFPEEVDLVRNW